jgi:hypothetical protein
MGSPLVSDWPQVNVKRSSLISLWLDFQVKILKMPAWDQKARRDSSSNRLKSYGTVVGFRHGPSASRRAWASVNKIY